MPADDERQTLGEEIIAWIESECRVPEGVLIGQLIQLMEWQKNFILKIYENPRAVTRRAILSVPRKCGKTCLAGCLLLVHLCGPASVPNSQLYSTAMSRDQAALLYGLAAKMVSACRRPEQSSRLQGRHKAIGVPSAGQRVSRAIVGKRGRIWLKSRICCAR